MADFNLGNYPGESIGELVSSNLAPPPKIILFKDPPRRLAICRGLGKSLLAQFANRTTVLSQRNHKTSPSHQLFGPVSLRCLISR